MVNDRPKRKAIPVRIKREVCERQGLLCYQCHEVPVHWETGSRTHMDHRPPLRLRGIRDDMRDYEPAQHDPIYLDALCVECHKLRTFRGTGADFCDLTKIKRERRREKERRGEGKKKRTWPKGRSLQSRPFPKVKRGFKARKPERRPERP